MEKKLIFYAKKAKQTKIIRFMKCCLIFIIIGIGSCFANETYSQRTFFSFEYNNRTVKEIIREIEQSSEYIFFYLDNSVNLNRKVSVKVENENVEKVLDQLFAGTRNQYYISDRQIVISSTKVAELPDIAPVLLQQLRTITGVVRDDAGPVIGANVIIKGTTNGAVTDINGQFTISNVQPNAVLQISFIGYISQEVTVGNQSQFDILISEDVGALEEVVVVGYGTQRKETLTGAVASINATELMSTKSENTINNMQGKMPGLLYRPNSGEPGDFTSGLSIRGFGTPVVVIDGVVRQRNGVAELAQLNAEDIESVSLLKDASAAIYGMNAANGVIVVTTKKGTDSKVRFSYSGMLGTKRPVAQMKTMSAYEHRLISNEMARNQGLAPAFSDIELDLFKQGTTPGYTDWDWIDMYIYDLTPLTNNHTMSARGGSDRISFFTSLAYSDDKGFITTDQQKYDRYTVRSNVEAKLTDDLKMNVNISGRFDRRQEFNGSFFSFYKNIIVNDRGIGPYSPSGQLTSQPPENRNLEYILTERGGYSRTRNHSLNMQMDFTYTPKFVPGLTINLFGAYEINNRNNSRLSRAYDMYDYITDNYITTSNSDSYSNTITLYDKIFGRLQANYKFKSGGHSLELMGAIEATAQRIDQLVGSRRFDEVFTYEIINQGTVATQTNSGYREYMNLAAFLGRINYDFQGKYLLEVMLRRDGSYRYAPNKRWAMFPAVSIGWRISEEDFFKNNVSFIDNLKLRFSYGESGRDQGTSFQYIAAYTTDNNRNYILNDGAYVVGMRPPGVVNDRLSWVSAKFYNAAVDIDFLQNKFSTTFELFQRFNTGLLATRINDVPNTFGADFPQENINSDMNIGLEVGLKYRDRIKDFRYSVGLNITFARTKRQHVERAPFTSQWDRWRNSNEERYTGRQGIYDSDGHFTSFEQLETAPLYGGTNGNRMMLPGSFIIRDNNGDGRINGDDQYYRNWAMGDGGYTSGASESIDGATWNRVNPPLQYGLPIEVNYKSWDISLLFTGAALYSLNINPGDVWGYGAFPSTPVLYSDRWRPVNPEADRWDPSTEWIEGTYAPLRTSTTGTQDKAAMKVYRPSATYLRMKSLEIGYTLPSSFNRRVGIERARFYLNGFNLVTFAPKLVRNYDPEKMEGDWNVGLSNPTMMSFNFGLNLTF